MKELAAIAQQAIIDMGQSGEIEKCIKKSIESTVKGIIESELRQYSSFGKKIEEHIKGCLNIDLAELGIDGHNDFILKMIDTLVAGELRTESNERLKEAITAIIANPPKEITLSEIVSTFKEEFNEHAMEEDYERMSFHYEGDSYFKYISMDKAPDKTRYNCAYRIGLTERDGQWEVFTMNIGNCDIDKTLFTGPFYKVERLLYKMHCAKSKVIFDVEPETIDLEYDRPQDY